MPQSSRPIFIVVVGLLIAAVSASGFVWWRAANENVESGQLRLSRRVVEERSFAEEESLTGASKADGLLTGQPEMPDPITSELAAIHSLPGCSTHGVDMVSPVSYSVESGETTTGILVGCRLHHQMYPAIFILDKQTLTIEWDNNYRFKDWEGWVRGIDAVDIDEDGINEVYWEGDSFGGPCAGGAHYQKLYSPKLGEEFSVTLSFSFEPDCAEPIYSPPNLSSNLYREEYIKFLDYLMNRWGDLRFNKTINEWNKGIKGE